MTTITFDTLNYFEKLKAAGVPEAQAKVQVEVLRDIVEDQLVTKTYLDIRLADLKHDLLKWMVGLTVAQLALIIALVAFIR